MVGSIASDHPSSKLSVFSGDSSSFVFVASGKMSAVLSGESSFVSSTKGTGSDGFGSSVARLWSIDGVEKAAAVVLEVFETFVAIGVVGSSVESALLLSPIGS